MSEAKKELEKICRECVFGGDDHYHAGYEKAIAKAIDKLLAYIEKEKAKWEEKQKISLDDVVYKYMKSYDYIPKSELRQLQQSQSERLRKVLEGLKYDEFSI